MPSVNGFLASVLINGIIGCISILLFSILRQRHAWLYAPRTLQRFASTEYASPPTLTSTKLFSWVADTLSVSEVQLLEYCGLDAVMYIRFFALCFNIFIVSSIWMIILIPIDITSYVDSTGGGEDGSDTDYDRLSEFDRFSMSVVPERSPRLWAHLVAAYFFTCIIMYYFKRTWHDYLFLRHRWMRTEHLKGRHLTLLIQNIPKHVYEHAQYTSSLEAVTHSAHEHHDEERGSDEDNTTDSRESGDSHNVNDKSQHKDSSNIQRYKQVADPRHMKDPSKQLVKTPNNKQNANGDSSLKQLQPSKKVTLSRSKPLQHQSIDDSNIDTKSRKEYQSTSDSTSKHKPRTNVASSGVPRLARSGSGTSLKFFDTWRKEKNTQKGRHNSHDRDNAFEVLYQKLFTPQDAHCAWQLKDTGIVGDLIYKRDQILSKLEHALIQYAESRNRRGIARAKRPTVYVGCFRKVDAIEYYNNALLYYNKVISELKTDIKLNARLLPSGFVHFVRSLAAYTARNLPTTAHPSEFDAKMAPEPEDVYYPNLSLKSQSKYWRRILVTCIVWSMVLAWTVPVVFAQSFTNLREIAQKLPWLQPVLTYNRAVTGILEGLLPAWIIVGFQMLLPFVLLALSILEGIEAHSWIQMSVLQKYFLFVLFNFFLASTVAGSILSVITRMIDRPTTVVDLLGRSIPKVSTFYITYILLRALTLFPLQLLRPVPLLYYSVLKNWFAKTPRELREFELPPQVQYGSDYADHLLVFLIGVIYSAISPIILPFCALFFAVGYVAMKYQLLYVYVSRWESGGRFWPIVYPRMMSGLIISQLTLIGLFGLKQGAQQSTWMLPLPILTYMAYRWIETHYAQKSLYLSVEECKAVDIEIDARIASAMERGEDNLSASKCIERLYRQPELRASSIAKPDIGEYNDILDELLTGEPTKPINGTSSSSSVNAAHDSIFNTSTDKTPLLSQHHDSRRRDI